MNRPDNISVYDELDLKLGIKSSLPHVKSTIALAILLWECADRPSELVYSVQNPEQNTDGIVMTDDLDQRVIDYLADICTEDQIDNKTLISEINKNQLFKSQMEALIVAFELVWKLAKVSFIDESKAASAERTGGTRYPKKLIYTINADIIHCLIESNRDAYVRVLLAWIGFNVNSDPECEKQLCQMLSVLSEGAVFKLTDGERDVIFNQNSLYRKLLETHDSVDINGDKESKGSLRILKSLLSDGLNPFLKYLNGVVSTNEQKAAELEVYQERVDTFLRLSATKVIGLEDIDAENEGIAPQEYEANRLTTGCNVLLYGVPGSGKSYTIEHEYCKPGSQVERLVFHPDYTYSDFIGQILPAVDDNGQVSYKFTAGPFTNILRESYNNSTTEYILIIEEINRGNAPAIFGEVFQLLDRKVELREVDDDGFPIGTSEYGITNANIARIVYGDEKHKVRIPSNLSIIGTMNTSDQNVFTLDTAFQRRWDMRLIENNFENVDPSLADATILDTSITWKDFCTEINKIVVGNGVRMTSAEDKRLGAYFLHLRDLKFDENMGDLADGEYDALRKKESHKQLTDTEKARLTEIRDAMKQNRKFPEKVIKYLWDDAFKFNREIIFETTEYQSLEQVIRAFMYAEKLDRFKMFKENVRSAFTNPED
jgi:ATPase family associated with various cellular activities (AAA)